MLNKLEKIPKWLQPKGTLSVNNHGVFIYNIPSDFIKLSRDISVYVKPSFVFKKIDSDDDNFYYGTGEDIAKSFENKIESR